MADIARHLGVSRQLVSIVLRDMPGASDETRAKVKKAAAELGYSPHQGARLLRQYSRRQIGVAFWPGHAAEPEIVEAIYTAVGDQSLQVVLSAQTPTRSTQQAVDELLTYRCAGLVLISPALEDEQVRAVAAKSQVPVVTVGLGEPNPAYDVVVSAGDTGMELLTRHLAGLGHRDTIYVDTPGMPPASLRRQGYLRAAGEAGLTPHVLAVAGTDYTEEAGAQAGRRLLERPALPTAVLASNDQVAVGVLQVLSRAGVRIPEDVSLTGYDDSRFASLSSVRLTTARQDPQEMGRKAVDAVVRRLGKPHAPPEMYVVRPTLVVRESTAPPRRGRDAATQE